MKVELLDCPFCGGQAEQAMYSHGKESNGVAVRCSRCGSSTEHIIYRHDAGFQEAYKRLKNSNIEAAKLWNKRCDN